MGFRDTLVTLAFVSISLGFYSVLVEPLVKKQLLSGGELYNWGVASAMFFLFGSIGAIIGRILLHRRKEVAL